MLVVADLLGVPESDHELFRARLGAGPSDETGTVGGTGDEALAHNPLEFLYEQFTAYVEDRRRDPRDDVLTGMATATFPDGSIPEAIDVARIAANLFAAGQETTVRLFGTALSASATTRSSSSSCATTGSASRTSSKSACASRAR